MRDIAVFAFLLGCIGATLWRPWLGVLCLSVFSYLNPHVYAFGFIRSFPVYQVLFIVAFFAMLKSEDRQAIPKDWRVYVFYMLWFYFLLTTLNAMVPSAAWPKLIEVSKIYLPLILTLLLIDTREKLYYLIITIAGSIGLIAVKGGIWAIGTGFNHRVYGPPTTQFYENNAMAIAILMTIPLLILWRRETRSQWIKYGLMAAIPLCFAAALSSWSRGALLTLAALAVVLIWDSKRKYLVVPIMVLGIYLALGQLPEEWFDRMHTIETYDEDGSAMGRIKAWTDGYQYALGHPLLGAGFEGWRFVTMKDWHSSYIEILAEHGFVAFAMWSSLLFGTIISLTRLNIITRRFPEMAWVKNYTTMLRASLIAYATGTIFLGLSYWDIFYHLVFISVLVKKFAQEEMAELGLIKKMPPAQIPATATSQAGSGPWSKNLR
jgi:probable O-glycosylation ligase (exosortase A-associated)